MLHKPELKKQENETNTLAYRKLYKKSEDFIKRLLKEQLPEGSKFFLFGSRAGDDHSRSSDIDIGVIAKDLDKKVIIKIKETIDESFVPFKVDIVDFSKVDDNFKKKALRRIVEWT